MSLQKGLEQIEHHWSRGKSHKLWKKYRNKWIRRRKITEIPSTRLRRGWEF